MFFHEPKEPKEPFLITNFMYGVKRNSMKLPSSDQIRESFINSSKKKMMKPGIEERLLNEKSKKFFKEKRLKRKLSKINNGNKFKNY